MRMKRNILSLGELLELITDLQICSLWMLWLLHIPQRYLRL